jgi:hypothetical protein
VSGLTFSVYNALNNTLVGALTSVLDGEFVDEFNAPGFGSVTVPLGSADAALLVKDAVVRVAYQNGTRFAFVIETLERVLAQEDGQQTVIAAGRGLLSVLEDAVVYPQGGLADFNTPDRPFNYASAPGTWRNSGNYQNALGVPWKDDTTARKGYPVRWKDRNAQWIWRTSPTSNTQTGTVNWFYRDITLNEGKRIKFFASADNSMQVWINGNRVMSSSDFDKDSPSFTQMARFTVRLGVGTHTIAARVRNGAPWTRDDLAVTASNDTVKAPNHGLVNGTELTVTEKEGAAGLSKGSNYFVRQRTDDTFKLATANNDGSIVNVTSNGELTLRLKDDRTAGFILTGIELDSNGREKSVAVRTGTAWQVSDTQPFWRPAMILRTLIEEAAARGVYRFDRFTFGFSDSAPTAGSWTTQTTLTLKAGSNLLTVLQDMVDLGHDLWLNPETMQLDAWESRGSDKSATVALALTQNLMGFSTAIERPLKTVALVRTSGGWLRAADSGLRNTNGWRETYLEYGNTESTDEARKNAQRVLRRTGKTQVVASGVEAVPVSGATPYVDFTVGDVVAIPNPAGSGAAGKARVLSIALKTVGGGVSFQPELEVITTT